MKVLYRTFKKTTARLACGGVLHERSPMNKKIERINNKIVCGAYGTVVRVQDRKASYWFLNWFTEVALTTEAGRAFHSLTTLFVKVLALCRHLMEAGPDSLLA
ncbi:hypothetical protein BpHYR1_036077 [Brachionus plicatilis]|uniref:Uncharacterized protein n=1 Tax=Brachionus plicatilis TaxID=10195 RepID=A0A3M7R9I1_BRAPC|nr:hypothetical protein BpHYR1_036077 [Brachionus plicatilis]